MILNIPFTDSNKYLMQALLQMIQESYPEFTIIGGEMDENAYSEHSIDKMPIGGVLTISDETDYDVTWYKNPLECYLATNSQQFMSFERNNIEPILKAIHQYAQSKYKQYNAGTKAFNRKDLLNSLPDNVVPRYRFDNGWIVTIMDTMIDVEIPDGSKQGKPGLYCIPIKMTQSYKEPAEHKKIRSMLQTLLQKRNDLHLTFTKI